jgi:synaptotagmin-like protein
MEEREVQGSQLIKASSMSSLGTRSESMASVYSQGEGRYGTVTVRGEVECGFIYSFGSGSLDISIKQCRDLAPVDLKRNRSDPYVKVYLLPDRSKAGKRKSQVKKHTLNPVFEELLKFVMPLGEVERRTMWISVWHSDMFGRNDFLGEVMLPMSGQLFDDPSSQWFNLQDRTEPPEDESVTNSKGDIIVALKYVPGEASGARKSSRKKGTLMILVKEAKNLPVPKGTTLPDPYCKCYLLPAVPSRGKQKTGICRRTTSPRWEQTIVWEDLSMEEVMERSLELAIWDHDRIGKTQDFLGGARFNLGSGRHLGRNVAWMDGTGKEVSLWQQMLDRPNFWVEGCIGLRPSLDTRPVNQ